MPCVVLAGRGDGAVKIGQVIVEQGFVLVKGIGKGILEAEVGKLLQKGGGETVEKARLGGIGNVFPGKEGEVFRPRRERGAVEEMGDAAVDVLFAGRGGLRPFHERREEGVLRIGKLAFAHAEGVQFRKGGRHGAHGRIDKFRRSADCYGIPLIPGGIEAGGGAVPQICYRDSGIPEVPVQPVADNCPEFLGEDFRHQELRGIHKLIRGPCRCI